MPTIIPLHNVHKIKEWREGGHDLLPVRRFTGCHPEDLFFENAECISAEFSVQSCTDISLEFSASNLSQWLTNLMHKIFVLQ